MTIRRYRLIVALALVAGGLSGCDAFLFDESAAGPDVHPQSPVTYGVLSTPAGITLQPLGKAQGTDLGKQTAARLPRDEVAYANADGMTLYTYDEDPPGRSTCLAECASTWPPTVAPPNAEPFGDWSVIARADGIRQWAYRNKPLYTYVGDVDPGSVAGNSPLVTGARRKNGAGRFVGGGVRGRVAVRGEKNELPEDWQPALLYPRSDMQLPPGFGMEEVLDVAALALTNHRGHTLYTFTGDSENEPAGVGRLWLPAPAPRLAEPYGDFTFIRRRDGIRQWAWRGRPLFTYRYDLASGDAFGEGTDERWHVAAVARHFMPPTVEIGDTPGLGTILTTADGMTLYKRDGYIHQSGGGYSLRRGIPTRPAVGRDIGTDAQCDAECKEVWRPFLAPEDATPRGYWDVYVREDGSKQWAYQGFALYTFEGDEKPGDINGNDRYDFFLDHEGEKVVNVGTPMDATASLYWGIIPP